MARISFRLAFMLVQDAVLLDTVSVISEESMDPEKRLELIALLAQDQAWDAVVLVGQALLDEYYPASIFTGVSGDSGPAYVVALRNALARVTNGQQEAGK